MRRDLNVKHYVGTIDELPNLKRAGDFFRVEGTSSTYTIGEDGVVTSITGAGEKAYQALLTQTNQAPPLANVLKNTIGEELVWERSSEGNYFTTITGNLIDRLSVIVPNGDGSSDTLIRTSTTYNSRDNETKVFVSSSNGLGSIISKADGIIENLTIKIELFAEKVVNFITFTGSSLTENWQDFGDGSVATHVDIDANYYHDGSSDLPISGDTVYTDESGSILLATGSAYYLGVVGVDEMWMSVNNGIVSFIGTYAQFAANG